MLLPFPSHIWVSGTRVPSFGWFSAWVPARVSYTDQRRRGLALAQVARTGPGHIWRASPAVCSSQLAPRFPGWLGLAKGQFCRLLVCTSQVLSVSKISPDLPTWAHGCLTCHNAPHLWVLKSDYQAQGREPCGQVSWEGSWAPGRDGK